MGAFRFKLALYVDANQLWSAYYTDLYRRRFGIPSIFA